jgi:hypothetical protein
MPHLGLCLGVLACNKHLRPNSQTPKRSMLPASVLVPYRPVCDDSPSNRYPSRGVVPSGAACLLSPLLLVSSSLLSPACICIPSSLLHIHAHLRTCTHTHGRSKWMHTQVVKRLSNETEVWDRELETYDYELLYHQAIQHTQVLTTLSFSFHPPFPFCSHRL